MSQLSIMKYYVLEYFFSFCINKKKKANREYATYLNGYRKFNKELDVVSLLRSVRLSKVLYHSTLNNRQSIMMQLQRSNVVESTDNSEGSDHLELVKDLNHPNRLVRIFALGQVNKAL